MKILGFQIYGYGKLENLEIGNLSSDIQVIYGFNEAGKSTLMSFIHSILFGFPTKLQSEQRYEPKSGSKYGGKIIIETDVYGTVTIERVRGKATGDVTVYFSDGTKGGEEAIRELFHSMDKNVYQSIYSFNIQGIQDVSRLSAEEIGRFLFSSGTIGTDGLVTINQKIAKEMDQLFKPNGKKPLLNTQIAELKELHTKVSKGQEKNKSYQDLITERNNIKKRLSQVDHELETSREKVATIKKIISLKPLLEEREVLLTRLHNLSSFSPFPVDGMRRFEALIAQLQPYETQLSALQLKHEELKKQLIQKKENEGILQLENDIQFVWSNKRQYEVHLQTLTKLQTSLEQLNKELEHDKELINLYLDDDEITSFDTSIPTKEYVKGLTTEFEKISHQKQLLDENFNRAKEVLTESEQRINQLKKLILPETKRHELEEIVNIYKEPDTKNESMRIVASIERLEKRINSLKKNERKAESSKQKMNILMVVLLCIGLVGFYLYTNNVIGALLIFVIMAIISIVLKVGSGESAYSSILNELTAEKEELQRKLDELREKTNSNVDMDSLQEQLIKDKQARNLIEVEEASRIQYEITYDKAVSSFEAWEKKLFECKRKIERYKRQYKLPELIAGEMLFDTLLIIEKIKSKIREKQRIVIEINNLEEEVALFKDKVYSLADYCVNDDQAQDILVLVGVIQERLIEARRDAEEILNNQKKYKEVEQEIEEVQAKILHIRQECQKLWKQAEVDTEDAFRIKASAYEESEIIKQKLLYLTSQLKSSQYADKSNEIDITPERLEFLDDEISNLKQEEKTLQLRQSEISIRLEELEEGGAFADLFHTFELKRSTFQQSVKKWAVLAVANDVLTKTTEQYRKVRLPQLIEKVEKYLNHLTEGEYVKVFSIAAEESFVVERVDGVRFHPSELSQATAEQLYVAFRFALASTMHKNNAFPVIIDDSFVNFDHRRLEKAISLLRSFSIKHQVLFFTCHEHMLHYFQNDEILNIST